jgi:hypothetical protein
MKWKQASSADVERFYRAVPQDPRVKRAAMFGIALSQVNGHNFAGQAGDGVVVSVSERWRTELLAQGAAPWEPLPGRKSKDKLVLPDALARDPKSLALWLRRAFDSALALPAKKAKSAKKKTSAPKAKRPAQARKK